MALLPWLGVSKWFRSLQPSMSEEPWIFLSAVWATFYWPNHLVNCCLQLNPSQCTKVNLFPAHKTWPPQLARGELLLFMLPSWDLRAKATLWAWEVAPSWNESATMLCFHPRHKAPTRLPCLYSGWFLPCCPARSVNHWTWCFSSSTSLWFVVKVISTLDSYSVGPFLFWLKEIRIQLINNFERSTIWLRGFSLLLSRNSV